MIVTGMAGQRKKLQQVLEDFFQQGKIVYGIHSSKATISTCFVTEYQQNHIHFIDGTDGGYTRAAVNFKRNLNRLKELSDMNSV